MRRRAFLSAAAGLTTATAGCVAPTGDGRGRLDGTATGTRKAGTRTAAPPGRRDLDLPVPEADLRRAAPQDAIPAIVDPAFGTDWGGIEYEVESANAGSSTVAPRLGDDERVIGVETADETRAYPLKVLRWHEVVNDAVGEAFAVTYCPVCRSGVVAEREFDDEPATFGVSGLLWRANLVLYDDRTDSLWSQIHATAIRGPATGTRLDLLGATLTTWGRLRETYPDVRVLLPPPESGTVLGDVRINYDLDPYERRARIAERWPDYGVVGEASDDGRLQPRTPVLGVVAGGVARAYQRRTVSSEGPINDVVGERPVVVAMDPDGGLVAYDRRIAGERLRFERDGESLRAGGSRWNPVSGRAIDGPHEGRRLHPVTGATAMYWGGWSEAYPETEIYGR